MAKYCVTLPITGYCLVEVEADSDERAIELAMDKSLTHADIEEWQTHSQICSGNVLHAQFNNAHAEKVEP